MSTLVELKAELGASLDAVDAKVDTVIDAVADFRSEYQQHTHEQWVRAGALRDLATHPAILNEER